LAKKTKSTVEPFNLAAIGELYSKLLRHTMKSVCGDRQSTRMVAKLTLQTEHRLVC